MLFSVGENAEGVGERQPGLGAADGENEAADARVGARAEKLRHLQPCR